MATCGVCLEAYNEKERRPKVLPCGHSFCLSCLLAIEKTKAGPIQCPSCMKQVLQRGATELPDNFALLSLGEKSVAQTQGHSGFFCLDCSRVASPACISDVHDLRLMAVHLRKLQVRLQEAVTELRGEVLAALDAKQSGSVEQLDQELQLLSCSDAVTISCDSWRAEALQLQQQPAVRAAMLVLLRQGQLDRVQVNTETPLHQPPANPPADLVQLVLSLSQYLPGQRTEKDAALQRLAPPAATVQLVLSLSRSPPGQRTEEKAAVLQLDAVHALTSVRCHRDPAWVLQVLRRHAASLQELKLYHVSREQLLELQSMPGLRRLIVSECQQDLEDSPALPGPWRGRLEWLRVDRLPKQTLQCLLSAHRDSLQELELRVGTPPEAGQQEDWPDSCSDLPAMLRGLRLRRLILWRIFCHSGCSAQLAALRAALPGCTVRCDKCNK